MLVKFDPVKAGTNNIFLSCFSALLQKIDANQDGLISFEELSQWCSREEHFVKSLSMLDTIL